MKTYSAVGALILLGLATGAAAQREAKYCINEYGERYPTFKKECPPGMSEVKSSRIRSCTLPDGSRAFGDKCPAEAAPAQELDEKELARRSSGASSRENSERMLRFGAEENWQRDRERRDSEHRAAEERYREEQRRYEEELLRAEAQRRSEEQRRRAADKY